MSIGKSISSISPFDDSYGNDISTSGVISYISSRRNEESPANNSLST